MLLAVPYFVLIYRLTTLLASGALGWLNLLALVTTSGQKSRSCGLAPSALSSLHAFVLRSSQPATTREGQANRAQLRDRTVRDMLKRAIL